MFAHISSATLRKMVKLSERKEKLMSQIQEIDRKMARLHAADSGARSDQANQNPSAGVRARRGALKASITDALRAAGGRGMSVAELSEKIGVKSANLYVWFNGTGRRTRGIKKLGPARYRFGG